MNPMTIILFAIIVTTVLTVLFSQSQEVGPRQKRSLWILLAVGLTAFGAIVVFVSMR